MRLAIDATPLTLPTGGVSRYTAELSTALARSFPEDEFWLLSDQSFPHPAPHLANLLTAAGPTGPLDRRWWLWGLPRAIARHSIDLFHGTDFSVPYLRLRPSVLTLHDLSPWLDPSWHHNAGRVRRRTPLLLRLGRATMVLTPSETVRRAAIDRFDIPPSRIAAVPHGANPRFRPVSAPPPPVPYFLYVGTLEPRKNLPLLLDAWRQARLKVPVDLVLAGRARPDFPPLAPEPGLHVLGPVPEDELPRLYSQALACLYPSLYEGFGLPVLEAMQCGALVLASRDPAIAELASHAALLLDPSDPRAWSQALIETASNPNFAPPFRALALARAADFSWDRAAAQTREVYAEAIRRFRSR